jgi:hypothetical protein
VSLPQPRNATETYLAAINDQLTQILDRLPASAEASEDGTVELREPDPQSRLQDAPVEPTQPAEKLAESAQPKARRRTTKRTGGA